jgi:hypothetical protein
MKVYDIVFVHHDGREEALASGLHDREVAVELTRRAAAERRVGRMVEPSSRSMPLCVLLRPRRVDP